MRHLLQPLITSLLILLWVYAATSKLVDYETSRSQMLNQVFPVWMAEVLTWAVPAVELLTAGLLIYPRTIRAGLLASLFLLMQFTIYIAVVMTGIMGRVPCSCGGVLEALTWGQHLIFNIGCIVIAIAGLLIRDRTQNIQEGVRYEPPAIRRV